MPDAPAAASTGHRRLYAAGAIILLLVAAYIFYRDFQSYRRLGTENDRIQQEIARCQRQIKVDIPQARDHLAALEEEQVEFRYRDRLPDTDGLDPLFDRLSEFEQTAGVLWEDSSSKESRSRRSSTSGEAWERLQYTLELTGSYFQFCRFINLLETMPRFVMIDEFTIKPAVREMPQEGDVPCAVKLTFSVFTLKPTSGAGEKRAAPSRGRTART